MANNREFFRQLAEFRLSEAALLNKQGQPSGAYYLAGYAIECALKAIIAAKFRENEIPDKALVNDVYTHDLAKLVRLAGLESELNDARRVGADLDRQWSIVKNWNEQARYSVWTAEQAAAIIEAIDGDGHTEGVFKWLTVRW
jgi:HEPN domain-containing protein